RMWGYIRSLYEQALPLMKEPGTIQEAIEMLRLIIKVQPDFQEATYALGYAHFLNGEMDEAIGAWSMTVDADPGNSKACFGLALAHMKSGDYEASRRYARMAREGGYPEEKLAQLLDELDSLTSPDDMYEDMTILPAFDPA
ncbi:tetratricopeptide repeat protein, partial [Candidatus Bathyarchaeota archaeon]